MYFLWGAISLFASFRLYTLYAASNKTWFLILIGTLCFGLGCKAATKVNFNILKNNSHQITTINTKYFWCMAIFTLLYGFGDMAVSIILMKSGVGLQEIRSAGFGLSDDVTGVAPKSAMATFIGMLVFGPIQTLTVALGIYFFLTKSSNNVIYIITAFFIVLEKSIATGGRFDLAYFVIELLVAYKIIGRHYISKRIRRLTKLYFLLGVSSILLITVLRNSDTSVMLQKYYRYFCGNVIFFDLRVEMLDNNGFMTLGYAALYGFFYPVFLILNNLIGLPYPSRYLEMSKIVLNTQEFAQIGDEMTTNAFSTPFYYLYADFRIIGVIIGMFLLGAFCNKMFIRCQRNLYGNMRPTIIYMIVVTALFNTIFCFPTVTTAFYLAIIYACLFIKGIPKKIDNVNI